MLRDARERYDVPVVEVILPATRRAVAATRNGRIGVICTRATAAVPGLRRRVRRRAPVTLTTQACPRFVEFVEQGVTGGPELQAAAHEYLDPLVAAGVDTLILGCTHYPLLTGVISYVMGDEVTLVSSAEECAKDVYRMLVQHGIERARRRRRAARAPLPDHRPARGVRDDRSPLPRPRARERHAVRRWRGWAMIARHGHEAHRHRQLGLLPRARTRSASCYLLEAEQDGRTWRVLLDLGNGALGSLQQYADAAHDRRGASSPTCTPTTASTCAATT